MDGEPENEENKVRTEGVVSADALKEGDNFAITLNRNDGEGDPAEIFASDHPEENSKSMKDTEEDLVEEAAASEPEVNSGDEPTAVDNIPTSEDMCLNINDVSEQPVSQEESVDFEINSSDEHEPPRLYLETPERDIISPPQEEEDKAEEEESSDASAEKYDIKYENYMQLFQELCEERDKASHHNSRLQMKLAEYFRTKAGDNIQLERELPVSEQLQEYEEHINILTDLKRQLITESEKAQQQAEELSLHSQERLDKVENEWRAFMALKQDEAVSALSRHLGKHAAQAKVEATLAGEQLRQDELIKQRLKHIKLEIRIRRLKAEIRDEEEQAKDPLQLQFERLQAERLEMKKNTEKQNEESLRMQKKISSSWEVLSNMREKLFWSQKEVQAKREQLAEVEAMVARRRDLLTRTKKARNSLQEDNLRLKENRGLLGNRVLLRDFENTTDACVYLEGRLENLKDQQADVVFRSGRWRKKLEPI